MDIEERQKQQERAFRKRLKQSLDAKGWTQKDLARRVHVAESTVTGWLRHGALPGADVLFNLPYVMGVSADWLLAGRGDGKPPATIETPNIAFLEGGRAALSEAEMALRDVSGRWRQEARAPEEQHATQVGEFVRQQAEQTEQTPTRQTRSRPKAV